MKSPFDIAKRYLEDKAPVPAPMATSTDPTEGCIVAVLIDSPIVGPVWFALDDGWKSGDDVPVFYASEIPHLQKMSPEQLRKRYEQKLALRGGWIRDKIEEPTMH
jgi:hypothetical protein